MKYWILTNSGIQFDLENPDASMIFVEDISHALSQMCRFNGHCDRFYSVAEHSLMIARVLPSEFRLAGLLHDATEAYLPDVTRPLKAMLPVFSDIESKVAAAIAEKFHIPFPLPKEVKVADNRMLKTEKHHLFSNEAARHAWHPSVDLLVPYDVGFIYRKDSPSTINHVLSAAINSYL